MMRTLIFYLAVLPLTLLMSLLVIPISWIGADAVHNWARLWGRIGLVLTGISLELESLEQIPRDRPVVFMANHQSNADILALLAGIPVQFRWLAKAELFRIPAFGGAMRRAGYIPVERGDRRKALEGMKTAAARIAAGSSVVIFPEGTRTEDGRLQEFKKGGFMVALQSGVPIVPVAIRGSYQVMPKYGRVVHGGRIRVTFFPPIETRDLSVRQINNLIAAVRAPIAAHLGESA
ncbi:1-acyl-sn-glycerol-3-phosphate acyltransferase [Geothermobacter hydrogeniphilus]|uniref:1-acyl-sn-glycerol-3-phosphate acyltransferase n=2 Tax=Geothermobacter hydrogeniphilus TaxID=1969733 RepID=A0A1X0XXR8_9BACT|nr:1-acyl-sn-glycerol-3-phosphate acyltransferase [Geothermobacter hydrogeniphilus]